MKFALDALAAGLSWPALAATLAAILVAYLLTSRRPSDPASPPVHRGIPVLGDAVFALSRRGMVWYRELHDKYGPTHTVSMFFAPTVVFCQYDHIKKLLGVV